MEIFRPKNEGGGALVVILVLTTLLSLLAAGLFQVSEVEQRNSSRRLAAKVANDANISAIEIVNQLVRTRAIRGVYSNTSKTTYWHPGPDGDGWRWQFTEGYTRDAAKQPVAKVDIQMCNPLVFTKDELRKMYSPTPELPQGCSTLQQTVTFETAKNGQYLELKTSVEVND